MKKIGMAVAGALLPFVLVSCASGPSASNVTGRLCLPQSDLRTLDHAPTLVAKNIPIVSKNARYTGEVGDTVIQRTLFGNFTGGLVKFSPSTGVPIPQTLAVVGGSNEADVEALISAEDVEALTSTYGCGVSPTFSAGKVLKQTYRKPKLEAATRWAKAMETNESRENTLLVGFKPTAAAYVATDYETAKLWLFSEPQDLDQRENLRSWKRYKAVGLMDYADPASIDLVVIKELKKSNDRWVFGKYFLSVTSSPIDVTETGEIVSKLWPDSTDFFDQRLIYNGISGETVKFLYREFTDNMNRSSFDQEVTYDLNLGEIIGFKGSRFVIHSATNTGIEYSILKPFNEDGVYRAAIGQPR